MYFSNCPTSVLDVNGMGGPYDPVSEGQEEKIGLTTNSPKGGEDPPVVYGFKIKSQCLNSLTDFLGACQPSVIGRFLELDPLRQYHFRSNQAEYHWGPLFLEKMTDDVQFKKQFQANVLEAIKVSKDEFQKTIFKKEYKYGVKFGGVRPPRSVMDELMDYIVDKDPNKKIVEDGEMQSFESVMFNQLTWIIRTSDVKVKVTVEKSGRIHGTLVISDYLNLDDHKGDEEYNKYARAVRTFYELGGGKFFKTKGYVSFSGDANDLASIQFRHHSKINEVKIWQNIRPGGPGTFTF